MAGSFFFFGLFAGNLEMMSLENKYKNEYNACCYLEKYCFISTLYKIPVDYSTSSTWIPLLFYQPYA